MSVQFGRWSCEGQSLTPDYIEKVNAILAPYGPDSNESYSKDGLSILYRAFHTTTESRSEVQPHVCASGVVLTWDGRLDNRAELVSELRDSLTIKSSDVAIVAVSYEKWGPKCLGKLIGDWALSIWNPSERSVLLAKDPIGTKHLYYSFDDKKLTWSTILDPLVLLAGKTFEVCEEYIAGWMAIPVFPAAHLTPYVGIDAVPPSSYVLLRRVKHGMIRTISKYWDFDPGKKIRYRTDAEYEEHFRSAMATAVQRRLRSDRLVLAELSGGMDSSSIVCMADMLIGRGAAGTPYLDTVSWYDDSNDDIEPDSNELHWISRVEQKRNRDGFHINTGAFHQEKAREADSQKSLEPMFDNDRFAATPIPDNRQSNFFKAYQGYIRSRGYRVTLSGIGGDEPTGGGAPTPTPELQNLLARSQFVALARQLKAWAARMRRNRFSLLCEAAQGFFAAHIDPPQDLCVAPWLHESFVRRNSRVFRGYPFRVKLFGPLPSFQDQVHKLEANRRFVAYCRLSSEVLREVRYPYYDRDLLEFLYAVPREQVVRVGQRRSLMKRAMVGIVPSELLSRRRKTFVRPLPKKDSSIEWPSPLDTGEHIIGSCAGVIDPDRFGAALRKARRNEDVSIESLQRTLTLEFWFRHLAVHGVLARGISTKRQDSFRLPKAMELHRPDSSGRV